MRKMMFIFLVSLVTLLTACVEEKPIEDEGPYKYDLTAENVQDFMVVTVTDVEVKSEHFLQYKLNLSFNFDDELGEPTTLILISFEIDIEIVFTFENEDAVVFLTQNVKFGSGAEGKDKVLTQDRQISNQEFDLTNATIIFDSIKWNKVDGHVFLNEKYS